jgi:hypothetical protein
MKSILRFALVISLIFSLVPQPTLAERAITLPFTEDFDSNDYTDLLWVEGSGSHSWESSSGWSGGAAKFVPPSSGPGQYIVGLGSFTGLNESQVNVRVLVYMGATYGESVGSVGYGYQNKFIIIDKSDSGNRGMSIFERWDSSPFHYSPGACDDNTCHYENGLGPYDLGDPPVYWPLGTDKFRSTDRQEEWFCFELEADLDTQTSTIYIWTQDGVMNGIYKTVPLADGSSYYSQVQVIGGFYNGYMTANADTYIMFDEVKIDNQFIGPPDGFLDDDPQASGITFSGVTIGQ